MKNKDAILSRSCVQKKKVFLQVLLTKVRLQYASAKRFLLMRNGTQVPLLFLTCKAVLKKGVSRSEPYGEKDGIRNGFDRIFVDGRPTSF